MTLGEVCFWKVCANHERARLLTLSLSLFGSSLCSQSLLFRRHRVSCLCVSLWFTCHCRSIRATQMAHKQSFKSHSTIVIVIICPSRRGMVAIRMSFANDTETASGKQRTPSPSSDPEQCKSGKFNPKTLISFVVVVVDRNRNKHSKPLPLLFGATNFSLSIYFWLCHQIFDVVILPYDVFGSLHLPPPTNGFGKSAA